MDSNSKRSHGENIKSTWSKSMTSIINVTWNTTTQSKMHARFNSEHTQTIIISWEVLCKEERGRTCTSLDPKEYIHTYTHGVRHGLRKKWDAKKHSSQPWHIKLLERTHF